MGKQIKLYSVLEHDTEFIKNKKNREKKISKREMRERGFIAKKSENQVKKIIENLKINEDERLEKWKLKKKG